MINQSLTKAEIAPTHTFPHGGAHELESPPAVCAALENPENNQDRGWGGARVGSGRKRKPDLPVPSWEPEGEHWYCVCAKPNEDLQADIQTRLAGFLVFAPTIWKPATVMRRDINGVVRRGLPDRIEPLFRRYFFTRFDRTNFSWTKILHLPGRPVQRIISSTLGFPIAVPDSFIETLQVFDRVINGVRHVARPNGCLYPEAPAKPTMLPSGTRVRPVEGAFVDMVGNLSQMSDGKRVKVLLEIMGRHVPVVMDQSAVEVVE
jgi:transcription antitermination factor NusG